MRWQLGTARGTFQIEFQLTYERLLLSPGLGEYRLKGEVINGSGRISGVDHVLAPEWFGETFGQAVRDAVYALMEENFIRPLTQKLMDDYTEQVASGKFQPPV